MRSTVLNTYNIIEIFRKKSILGTILVLLTLTSCQSLITKYLVSTANINKNLKVLESKETKQTIVFFPMVHIGKPEYYDNCKKIIDSLRSDGFKFYYESLSMDSTIHSTKKSIYNKKVRSILGYNPLHSDANESLPASFKKKNIVLQNYTKMGLYAKDTNLDLFENQIIDSIEKKYGPIILTECDFTTGELEKYNCKNDNKVNKFALTNEFRDPYIANEVMKLQDKKIVLIYGKMHWYFIYPSLKQNGFEITKGKI